MSQVKLNPMVDLGLDFDPQANQSGSVANQPVPTVSSNSPTTPASSLQSFNTSTASASAPQLTQYTSADMVPANQDQGTNILLIISAILFFSAFGVLVYYLLLYFKLI